MGHWLLRLFFAEDYLDMSSIINGLLGVVFFADYVVFKLKSGSPLSRFCILIDAGLQEVRENVLVTLSDVRKTLTGTKDFELIPVSPHSPHSPQAEQVGRIRSDLSDRSEVIELADAA